MTEVEDILPLFYEDNKQREIRANKESSLTWQLTPPHIILCMPGLIFVFREQKEILEVVQQRRLFDWTRMVGPRWCSA